MDENYQVECFRDECEWFGPIGAVKHLANDPDTLLCPICLDRIILPEGAQLDGEGSRG